MRLDGQCGRVVARAVALSYTRLASDSDLEMAWPPDANLERNCGANVGIDISDVDR